MRIVLLITVLEGIVLTLWILIRRHYKNLPLSASAAPRERSLAGEYLLRPGNLARWEFISEWQSEGQADDRSPMLDTVAEIAGSPAARRSSARRSHQLHFKKWSSERHD